MTSALVTIGGGSRRASKGESGVAAAPLVSGAGRSDTDAVWTNRMIVHASAMIGITDTAAI